MKKKGAPEVGHDVLRRYMVGGTLKSRQIAKKGKASRTGAKIARLYVAIPPEGGWPGGMPEHNGYKPGGGKK